MHMTTIHQEQMTNKPSKRMLVHIKGKYCIRSYLQQVRYFVVAIQVSILGNIQYSNKSKKKGTQYQCRLSDPRMLAVIILVFDIYS